MDGLVGKIKKNQTKQLKVETPIQQLKKMQSENSTDRTEQVSTVSSSSFSKRIRQECGFDTKKYTHLNCFNHEKNDIFDNSASIKDVENRHGNIGSSTFAELASTVRQYKPIKSNKNHVRSKRAKTSRASSKISINLCMLKSQEKSKSKKREKSAVSSRKQSTCPSNLDEAVPEHSARIR
jgi:hypothetical protein